MADLRSYLVGLSAGGDNLAAPSNDIQFVGNFGFVFDGTNWDRMPGNATDGVLVDLGDNNDVVVSATNLDIRDLAQATDNVRVYANTAKDGSGTAYIPLVDADGHLQIDVLSGGGVDAPTNPSNAYVTSAGLAAGSSANLSTADLGAKKLAQVEAWSSVPFKAALHTVANGTASTDPIAIGGGPAHTSWTWKAPHRNYAAVTSSGGVDGFRVVMTNLDDQNAADVFATFHVED